MGYSKLSSRGDEIEMTEYGRSKGKAELDDLLYEVAHTKKEAIRPHDIYDKTRTMPNQELKLIEVTVNSSLYFQMLLFYHSTYNILFTILMAWPCVYRLLWSFRVDEFNIIQPIILVVWIPIEYARLNFGWRGNLDELFPELFAFWIFTVIFSFPMQFSLQLIGPMFPHE